VAQLARGRELAEAGRGAEAVPYLERAKALFPDLAGPESPRWHLARIYEARGDLRAAAAELDTLTTRGEAPYEALLALARLREALGDRPGAAAALARAIWVSPYDVALHQRLAALYEATGATREAVREWRAVVALDPTDRAEALYRLALAYERAGDVAEARRAVLRALEEAPNYEKAQELLLRLRGGGR
jgi:tetratricopeptide (TPR) repeat protein